MLRVLRSGRTRESAPRIPISTLFALGVTGPPVPGVEIPVHGVEAPPEAQGEPEESEEDPRPEPAIEPDACEREEPDGDEEL